MSDKRGHRAFSVASRDAYNAPFDVRYDEIQFSHYGNAPPFRLLDAKRGRRYPRAEQQNVGLESAIAVPSNFPLYSDIFQPLDGILRQSTLFFGHKNLRPQLAG